MIKLCRKHAEVISNHLNPNVPATGQEEDMYKEQEQVDDVRERKIRNK
jgi:hypothetical protein